MISPHITCDWKKKSCRAEHAAKANVQLALKRKRLKDLMARKLGRATDYHTELFLCRAYQLVYTLFILDDRTIVNLNVKSRAVKREELSVCSP